MLANLVRRQLFHRVVPPLRQLRRLLATTKTVTFRTWLITTMAIPIAGEAPQGARHSPTPSGKAPGPQVATRCTAAAQAVIGIFTLASGGGAGEDTHTEGVGDGMPARVTRKVCQRVRGPCLLTGSQVALRKRSPPLNPRRQIPLHRSLSRSPRLSRVPLQVLFGDAVKEEYPHRGLKATMPGDRVILQPPSPEQEELKLAAKASERRC